MKRQGTRRLQKVIHTPRALTAAWGSRGISRGQKWEKQLVVTREFRIEWSLFYEIYINLYHGMLVIISFFFEVHVDLMGIPFGNQTWRAGKWSTNCEISILVG